jgi:hypothetical protein
MGTTIDDKRPFVPDLAHSLTAPPPPPPPPPPPKAPDLNDLPPTPLPEGMIGTKPTLYLEGIRSSDVNQGSIGDCTLDASLAGLAQTDAGRAFIHRSIEPAGNGSYKVTVFVRTPLGLWPRQVLVGPADIKANGNKPVTSGGLREEWTRVIEAALLKANGGSPTTNMPDTYGALTGKPATDIPTSSSVAFFRRFFSDLDAKHVQVLSTTGAFTTPLTSPRLHPNHAYTVTAVIQRNGEPYVVLRNPWGNDHPEPIPFKDIPRYFPTYSSGEIP